MQSQFEYYTKYITLRPFGGDPSIPYKWTIAKELEQAYRVYGLPIPVLYFGDLDPQGLTIPESAVKDIREWCAAEFDYIRAGLNPGDEAKYSIPENPDRPGTYQWEALDDVTAKELITGAVYRFVSHGLLSEAEQEGQEITSRFQKLWQRFAGL